MKISIVVPCRNERAHIKPFIDSVMSQELAPGDALEIVVADGQSDDGTTEVLHQAARSLPLRVIGNPERIVSTGLNAAIAESSGDVIVRMDVHTTYAVDYVRQCREVLVETGADSVGGPWVARGRGLLGQAIAAAFHSPFCSGGAKAHRADYEGEVDTVYLGCWPRQIFQSVGLFDPDLVRNQDDEFHFRLKRAGGRIWQSPRIRSFYTPRNSLRALFRQYMQYGFWKVAVMRKHRGVAAVRHAIPGLFVGSLIGGALLIALTWLLGWHSFAESVSLILAIELGVYVVALTAAALTDLRTQPWRVVLLMPIVIAIYHIAYGWGFLAGLVVHARRKQNSANRELFTALSR